MPPCHYDVELHVILTGDDPDAVARNFTKVVAEARAQPFIRARRSKQAENWYFVDNATGTTELHIDTYTFHPDAVRARRVVRRPGARPAWVEYESKRVAAGKTGCDQDAMQYNHQIQCTPICARCRERRYVFDAMPCDTSSGRGGFSTCSKGSKRWTAFTRHKRYTVPDDMFFPMQTCNFYGLELPCPAKSSLWNSKAVYKSFFWLPDRLAFRSVTKDMLREKHRNNTFFDGWDAGIGKHCARVSWVQRGVFEKQLATVVPSIARAISCLHEHGYASLLDDVEMLSTKQRQRLLALGMFQFAPAAAVTNLPVEPEQHVVASTTTTRMARSSPSSTTSTTALDNESILFQPHAPG